MPRIRADIVDVYVFRRGSGEVEFLQLLRAHEAGGALGGTWQPVMGHIEGDETAAACAWRELEEEVGLAKGDAALLGVWALEQVHPYFLAGKDVIVLSPRFAAEVGKEWRPRLNAEHSDWRWVRAGDVARMFMWPGQGAAIAEILGWLLREGALGAEGTRIG